VPDLLSAWSGISEIEEKAPFSLACHDTTLALAVPDRVFARPEERDAAVVRMREFVDAAANSASPQ
jgi:hypothetical protein